MKNSILLIIGYIFGRKQFYKVGMVLQHIAHRMMGIGNYENTFLSGENFVVQHIHRLLSSKDAITFIDVGAGSKSENTKLVLEYFPNSRCYLFEPMAATFKGLKQLYSGNRNVTCYQLAVGNKNTDIEIWDYENSSSQHATLNKESIQHSGRKVKKHKIKQIDLSSFMKQEKLKSVDFLKIDVEGFDYFVLQGLRTNIKKTSFIQFEFNSMNGFTDVSFKKFFDLLNPDFKLYRIYQDGLLEVKIYNPIYNEIYEFQNYLAVNRKLSNVGS